MTITLPDERKDEVVNKARAAGFTNVADYVLRLVADDEPVVGLPDACGPPGLTPSDRAELEDMLEAGLNSGLPVYSTPVFWQERQQVLAARIAIRKGEPT